MRKYKNKDTKILKRKIIDFDGEKLEISKAMVNVKNSHQITRFFVRKCNQ